MADCHQTVGDLFEDAVTEVVGLAGAGKRSPQVIDGRGPCQPQRCERLALRFGYHGSMARRCLA